MLYAFSIIGPDQDHATSFTTESRETVIAVAATPMTILSGKWSMENAIALITQLVKQAEEDSNKVAWASPQTDPTKPRDWCQTFFDISVTVLHR